MKKQEIYLIEIYVNNKDFEARASIPEGRWLDEIISSGTLHGLASKAAERWTLNNGDVDYTTIDGPEFDAVKNNSRDPITGQQMKDFHYWYCEYSKKE
jgi:hypothetical protein